MPIIEGFDDFDYNKLVHELIYGRGFKTEYIFFLETGSIISLTTKAIEIDKGFRGSFYFLTSGYFPIYSEDGDHIANYVSNTRITLEQSIDRGMPFAAIPRMACYTEESTDWFRSILS